MTQPDPDNGYPSDWDTPDMKQMRDARQQAAAERASAAESARLIQRLERATPGGSPTPRPNPHDYPSHWTV